MPQLLDIDLAVSQAANAPSRAAWLASGPAAANSLGNTAEKFKLALLGEVSESFVTSQSSAGIDQTACNSVDIPATSNPPEPPPTSPFCTYQQSLWGNADQTGTTLSALGFPVTVGGSNEMTFTTPVAVQDYLPAGGTNGALSDPLLTNPTSTSAGHFGGSVLALELNVLSNSGFGDLTLCGLTSTEADFDGMTVNDVLSAANAVLGGAEISTSNPGDYNGYDALLQHLNVSYQQCNETGFAKNHLVSGSCP